MSARKKAVSSMLGGLSINAIQPYKNVDNILFNELDIKNRVTTQLGNINSTKDLSDNTNIVNKTYYVKYGRGEIFDPYGIDREKIKRPYYSFKKVNNKIFDHYVSYLKTEKRIFLTRRRKS